MKTKIIGIFVCMLLIATAIPVVGTITKINDTHGILTDTPSPIFYGNKRCSILSPDIEWENTYGGPKDDKFWAVAQTDDGYIASGTTNTPLPYKNYDCPWVVKVDTNGNEEWNWTIHEFTYNNTDYNITNCWVDDVMQTSDGGYLAGFILLFYHNSEQYDTGGLVKLDTNGNLEWMKLYIESFNWTIHVEEIDEVSDGYIGIGTYGAPLDTERDKQGCLFKTDFNGELLWYKYYNYGDLYDKFFGFNSTSDGGYILFGCVGIIDNINWDAWMVKTDANGNEQWNTTLSGSKNDGFFDGYQTSKNEYIIMGWTASFGYGSNDVWIVKTDATGQELENTTYGGKGFDGAYGLDTTDDGGCIIAVHISSWTDGWILKLDVDGNLLWKEIYGDMGTQFFLGICSTDHGGCIACGASGSVGDALLVKYEAFENQRPDKPDKPSGKNKGKPGPVYTYKSSTTDSDGDQVEYLWDWGDGNFSDWLGPFDSGDVCEAEYYWEDEGEYNIKVMARDSHGGESVWSDPFPVKMPKNKPYIFNFPLLNWLFERFPNAFPIMRYIVGL